MAENTQNLAKTQVPFTIKPLNKKDQFYGFTLDKDPMHVMPNGVIFHNSGKSVMEQAIVGHVSRYADRFQLVGVDCKRFKMRISIEPYYSGV
jgi:hypothetical protein